ncbi:MATE family efflux transporter [Costertonia aggregata]|uniref:Oligosaccharide flippase family protein n=1 Tax=Costertonia aggregata TaxID=343403 RepID=A0A7H9APD2_9FLAO|nr:hypothetical protein [Costertonia aggregata]QLG45243.1 hypothetical protein HYG79_07750 [Costertonia aggregata]
MKNIFRNPMFTSWIFTGSKMIVLLVLTTLIVKKFSVGEIALWYLFTSIQGFAHLFDIGFSSTIIRFTAYSAANKDPNHFSKSFQLLYGSMNTVFAILVLFVMGFFVAIGFLSVNEVVQENNITHGFTAFLILALIMPINFFLKKNDAFIKGLNQISLFNNWNAILYFVSGVATIIAIWMDLPFYIVVLTNQLFNVVNSIKNVFLLRSIVNFKFNIFRFSFDKEILLEYWRPTWKSALISFSSNGANNLINIMIPNFFGVEIIASYLFSMRIIQFVNEFSWPPFYAYLPEFIKKYKQGDVLYTAKKAYSKLEFSIVLLILGITALSVTADFALSLINAKTTFIPIPLMVFLLLMLILERFTAMHSQIIMFSNDIEHYKQYLFLSISFIGLTFGLINIFGLYAIPLAYTGSVFFPLKVMMERSLRLMKVNFWDYVRNYMKKIIIVSVICLIILVIAVW